MNFPMNWRDRRTILAPMHHPFASYCTDTKTDMKTSFGEDLFMNNLYWGPDPLRKNLADTIMKEEKMCKKELEKENEIKTEKENTHIHEDNSRLSGITSFFSGVLNIISNAMFSKRKPADFNTELESEMALPSMWRGAKFSDENKILQDEISNDTSNVFASEMSDCRSAAAHCQSKLEHVRVLLGSSKPVPCSLRVRKRPKKVFVEANSVEDCFEDAFSPEDFENLSNDSYIEFSSPACYQESVFHEADGPKVKVETVASKVTSDMPKVATEPPKVHTKETVPEAVKVVSETPKMPVNSKTPNSLTEMSNIITKPLPSDNLNVSIETQKMVTEEPLTCGTAEIVTNLPELKTENNKDQLKNELIESCEDKITKLKLLLKEKREKSKLVADQQPPTTLPEPEPLLSTLPEAQLEPQPLVKLPPRPKPCNKNKIKCFRNPDRCSDKRKKTRMRKFIHDDALFGNELSSEEVSSVENSPSNNNMENCIKKLHKPMPKMENCYQTQPRPVPKKDYFDEVSGRFHSGSVDSEDSFQIVFSDSPKVRRSSDCGSEDSFIVFEDSPDGCYTSNDVFGDSTDSEDSDSASDSDSDSDMSDSGRDTLKLSVSLSKSVNNLADDSLYADQSEDEVDCAVVYDSTVCDNLTVGDISDTCESTNSKGVLVTKRKKLLRKDLPAKRVHFSSDPPKVHVMRVWLYAAKQTRCRYWEQFVTDRERFKRRIADIDMAVSWVLKPQHRSRIMFQRFMPWWNAQKRKELAEKEEREAREKLKEEERLRNEEIEGLKLTDKDNEALEGSKEVLVGDGVVKKDLDQNQSSGQIVPFNEKVLDLNSDYVSGILRT